MANHNRKIFFLIFVTDLSDHFMDCPHCHSKGSVFRKIFLKQKGSKNRFCMYCNAEVIIRYNWKKILVLCLIVMGILFVVNMIIQLLGSYGLTSGFAGGIAGAIIAIMMRKPPYVVVELVRKPGKKRHK